MVYTLKNEKDYETFVKMHVDEIKADAAVGHSSAVNLITLHRMLVKQADGPTWALFMGAVDGWIKDRK